MQKLAELAKDVRETEYTSKGDRLYEKRDLVYK